MADSQVGAQVGIEASGEAEKIPMKALGEMSGAVGGGGGGVEAPPPPPPMKSLPGGINVIDNARGEDPLEFVHNPMVQQIVQSQQMGGAG